MPPADLDQLQPLHPLSNSDLFRIARHHRPAGVWRSVLDWFGRDRRRIADEAASFGTCHLEIGDGRSGRLRRLMRQAVRCGPVLRRLHLVGASRRTVRGLAGDDRVRIQPGTVLDLALASGSIDSCHASMPLDAVAAARIHRLLRPGARLTVELRLQPVGPLLARWFRRPDPHPGTGSIRMPPAARSLRRDLRSAGFRIAQTWTDQDSWRLVAVR